MADLDQSQLEFCQSTERNIRLLAPAGCGKTSSLLYRCKFLLQHANSSRAKSRPRFLIITFTKAAAEELRYRLIIESAFEPLRDQVTITTLNAYGYRRIRNNVGNYRLLKSNNDRYFAVRNQLRPDWIENPYIEPVATARNRKGVRDLLTVMDNLKAMGFDHTEDTNFSSFKDRLSGLESQGASNWIDEQFDILTRIKVLDSLIDLGSLLNGGEERASTNRRAFYDRFFTFWRKATAHLIEQSTFTFEDQKYWAYLDLKSPGADGKDKPYIHGAARYDHILIDEFQDINPLDLKLIKVIAERNQATITVMGDDDQAIFEWRGATPEYILNPQRYFGFPFVDYQLGVNYRSPKNIVELSQSLISHNKNRFHKNVKASENATNAKIERIRTGSTTQRLRLVTDIVRYAKHPGKVAVIGRVRSQLIPYEVYFASDGAPFKTATDLNVFASDAFESLTKLLEIWDRSSLATGQSVRDALEICNLIKRFPFSKKDLGNLQEHLQGRRPKTALEAVESIGSYAGPKLSGKNHLQLHSAANEFLNANNVADAVVVVDEHFSGLRFDQDKSEDDIWYTDPPLGQLADIARGEALGASDLIERIEIAKHRTREYQSFEDDADTTKEPTWERPLHLMTATRAKGKEFDTVILLDTVEGVWPHSRAKQQREMEAERRLFYVAFTRARREVVLLTSDGSVEISRFVEELGLDQL